MRTFSKYLLLQIPGLLIVAVVLLALWEWSGLSSVVAVALFLVWIVKDVLMFPLVRRAYESDAKTGVDQLIGLAGTAREPMSPDGYVFVRGELWRARLRPGDEPIPVGSTVRVVAADRFTLIVTADSGSSARKRLGDGHAGSSSRLAVVVIALLASGPSTSSSQEPRHPPTSNSRPGSASNMPTPAGRGPQQLRVQVVSSYPHDPEAFTQGLLLHDGVLYESTGRYGRSSLRQVDLTTGQIVRHVDLPTTSFGEGLARVGQQLIQLTWRGGVAFVYDLTSFERVGKFTYPTQGWGLCFDGQHLVMSDGSHRLYFRDPTSFAVTRQLAVTREGQPQQGLNELECVGESVYANVWPTERIVEITKRNGVVRAVIDASPLSANVPGRSSDAILNGIAYDDRDRTFLVTGKLWPKLFSVRFVPGG